MRLFAWKLSPTFRLFIPTFSATKRTVCQRRITHNLYTMTAGAKQHFAVEVLRGLRMNEGRVRSNILPKLAAPPSLTKICYRAMVSCSSILGWLMINCKRHGWETPSWSRFYTRWKNINTIIGRSFNSRDSGEISVVILEAYISGVKHNMTVCEIGGCACRFLECRFWWKRWYVFDLLRLERFACLLDFYLQYLNNRHRVSKIFEDIHINSIST